MQYTFRKATAADLGTIMDIIQEAKEQMSREGKHQWDDSYPTQQHIETDILAGNGYVMAHDGRPVAYGAVVLTGEPAYDVIEGHWLSEQPYAVLHRLAVSEAIKGHGFGVQFMQEVERIAVAAGIHSFKVDTNHDNTRMLHVLDKMGFSHCGNIFYPQGSRIAFEKLL